MVASATPAMSPMSAIQTEHLQWMQALIQRWNTHLSPFSVFLSSDAWDAMKIAAAAIEIGLLLKTQETREKVRKLIEQWLSVTRYAPSAQVEVVRVLRDDGGSLLDLVGETQVGAESRHKVFRRNDVNTGFQRLQNQLERASDFALGHFRYSNNLCV